MNGSGVNSGLTDTGRQQVSMFYERYKNTSFDKIYLSTLPRTYESVLPFINQGIPYETLKGLDEIHWGTLEGRPLEGEVKAHYEAIKQAWTRNDWEKAMEKGESPAMVQIRQQEAIKTILQRESETTILLCMHGRALRILLTWLFNLPLSSMEDFVHENMGLYVMEYENGRFTLVTRNDTSHLTD